MNAKITVPISECYDRLSIIEVKRIYQPLNLDLLHQLNEIQEEISLVLGYEFAHNIYSSEEYQKLYNANLEIFKLIDRLNKGELNLGKEINDKNYERFLAKNNLQKHFFNKSIGEIKIGY